MSLRLCLLVDNSPVGLFYRWNTSREICDFFSEDILPNMTASMSDGFFSEHYPWCFVISSVALRGRHYYVGAYRVFQGEQGGRKLIVIYSTVSYSWLQANMRTEFPLTFWAARILNNLSTREVNGKNWQPLRQWITALRRSYSPLWESLALTPAWRFKSQAQALLRPGSPEDYRILDRDGVEIMPWKNWPDCIQQEAGIWIWRQSRYRKILDSQRIPLRCTLG